jgi:hypothetical protein
VNQVSTNKMKKIEFTTHVPDDRIIRVSSQNGVITDINFIQGTTENDFNDLAKWFTNTELTQWLHQRGIGNQLPIDYVDLNHGIWIWLWMTNGDPKPTKEIDGVKWYWHELDEVWYNSETLYVEEDLPSDDVVLKLPKGQRDIIIKALRFYGECYNRFNQVPTDKEYYEMFDIRTLVGLMHYDVDVRIKGDDVDGFTAIHGIDLPNYNN